MNPVLLLKKFFGETIYDVVLKISVLILILGVLHYMHITLAPLNFILWSALIAISSIVIWRAGDYFSPAAIYIEDHYDIPQSVKAAVIDAIASSFPEFAVAIIAVINLGVAEVGIATIVGSALYNVLVIPAAVGLVATTPVLVSREVVWRDNLYYVFVVFLLLGIFLLFPNEWGLGVSIVFLVAYLGYILMLQHHYKTHKAQIQSQEVEEEEEEEDLHIDSKKEAWMWIFGMMLVMGAASHVLVTASIALGNLLGISAVIMAFVVIAAGTSVPDMVLSILSAKRGNYDAAISNVFGSNIFDICVCLSIPMMLALLMTGKNTPINMPQTYLIFMLLVSTFLAFYCFWSNNYTLTRFKAGLLGATYILIIVVTLILR